MRYTIEDVRKQWDEVFNAQYAAKISRDLLPKYESPRGISKKLVNYCLDTTHSIGKHKAVVFQSALGYNISNAGALERQIEKGLRVYRGIPLGDSSYGYRYNVVMLVKGANGKTQPVVTSWIYDKGYDTPRMVTAYVSEKRRP